MEAFKKKMRKVVTGNENQKIHHWVQGKETPDACSQLDESAGARLGLTVESDTATTFASTAETQTPSTKVPPCPSLKAPFQTACTTFDINIKPLESDAFRVEVNDAMSIAQLKDLIQQKEGIASHLQVVALGRQKLDGAKLLSEYGIKAGAIVTLLKADVPAGQSPMNITFVNFHEVTEISRYSAEEVLAERQDVRFSLTPGESEDLLRVWDEKQDLKNLRPKGEGYFKTTTDEVTEISRYSAEEVLACIQKYQDGEEDKDSQQHILLAKELVDDVSCYQDEEVVDILGMNRVQSQHLLGGADHCYWDMGNKRWRKWKEDTEWPEWCLVSLTAPPMLEEIKQVVQTAGCATGFHFEHYQQQYTGCELSLGDVFLVAGHLLQFEFSMVDPGY